MAMDRRQTAARVLAPPLGHPYPPRRPEGSGRERAVGEIPVEISFLAALGVAPGLLLKAAARARAVGVPAERALMGAGFPEDTFYRLLARHLGMPYLEEPMRLAPPAVARPQAEAVGLVPLAPNDRGLDLVIAPQGPGLLALLRLIAPGQGRGTRTVIAAPRRLNALLRKRDRAALLIMASHGLAAWDPSLSASAGLTAGQTVAGAAFALLVGAGLVLAPAPTLAGLTVLISLLFFTAVMVRLVATASSTVPPPPREEGPPDGALPVYTVVVPLFREARMAGQIVAALAALDYPCSKLDVKLMVEADDPATVAALEALNLPVHFETIVAPRGQPRTKPRALNIALGYARGDFLVVFDAEDRPEPDQLRAAVGRFMARPSRVACLQARLAIDHADESWLTRMFALEYAALFHVVKPGLAALKLPMPLGGTSNHFRVEALRRVGGWDSWNVTEDIDLGFRLARFGYRVEALESTTFEEAPLSLGKWLPQRTRWLKGWMITLMVHSRQPVRLFRELGFWGGVSVTAALCGTVLSTLFGPVLFGVAVAEAIFGPWFSPATPGQALLGAAACFLMVIGVAALLWPIRLGLKRRGRLDLLPWAVTLPAYLLLCSFAGWRALAEAIVDPQRWNKTEHGLAKHRAALGAASALPPGA